MAYVNSMIDNSPTKVFTASTSITGGAFHAVELGASGVALAGASSAVLGIMTAETDTLVAAGDDVNVQICGGTVWQVGESVQAGDALAAGADGKAAKAAAGKMIFGRALEGGKANQNVHVLITREGKD